MRLRKIYKRLLQRCEKDAVGWYNDYKDIVSAVEAWRQARESPTSLLSVKEDHKLLQRLLYDNSNGVSDYGQSILGWDTFESLINDERFITAASALMHVSTHENFVALSRAMKEFMDERNKRMPWLRLCRFASACDLRLTTIVNEGYFNSVFWDLVNNELINAPDEQTKNSDWYQKNIWLTKQIDQKLVPEIDEDKCAFDDPYWRNIFVWLLRTRYFNKEVFMDLMNIIESNKNVVFTGAPGTGKTFLARQIAHQMILKRVVNDEEDLSESEKKILDKRLCFVQFHPGYDYSDFVMGLKPILLDENGNEVQDGESKSKVTVSYRWKPGVFKKFADAATDDSENNYVLVIDEINRADLSRVFGELFSLIEKDYRGEAKVTLPNGAKFSVPKNLYIIGTMNDIDRSVDSMDFALRRRFAWYEVSAECSECIIDAKVSNPSLAKKLKTAMSSINDAIRGGKVTVDTRELSLGLGPEYELGGAIFANAAKYGGSADIPRKLWNNHIKVILSEYLRGNREAMAILKVLEGIYNKEMAS